MSAKYNPQYDNETFNENVNGKPTFDDITDDNKEHAYDYVDQLIQDAQGE